MQVWQLLTAVHVKHMFGHTTHVPFKSNNPLGQTSIQKLLY